MSCSLRRFGFARLVVLLGVALSPSSCRCVSGSDHGGRRRSDAAVAARRCACEGRWRPFPFGPIPDPPGAAPATAPPGARPLTIQLETEPVHLLPMLRPDASSYRVVGHDVLESLVRLDPATGEVRPELAQTWESSPDGRVVTLHLRHGVVFHDGHPFTSEDVRFTFDRLLDPTVQAASQRSDFELLSACETPGPYTVVLRFREPHFLVFQNLERLAILPRHVYGIGDLNTHPNLRRPVGTGPFRFVRWTPGERIELARFDRYWGTPAREPRVAYRIVSDYTAAFDLAQRGEIDVVSRLLPEQAEQLRTDRAVRERLRAVPTLPGGYSFIVYNTRDPQLADPRVRRAFGMLLDRVAIHCDIDHCLSRPARSPFPPGHPVDATAPEPRLDLAGATLLLDAAGLRDRDGDGVRESASGPVRLTVLVPASSRVVQRVLELLQQRMREVGVRLDITPLEWGAFLTRLSEHRFEAAALQWAVDPETDPYPLFHSSQIDGGLNYGALRDAEVDRLLEQGRRTLDRDARNVVFERLVARLGELAPYTFLSSTLRVAAVTPRVRGLVATPFGLSARDMTIH